MRKKGTDKKLGFTLAEVLIVLGVIGIIANMTIPTLMNNVQRQVTVTTLEKTYTDLSQAIKLSEIDNGPISDWDFTTNNTTIAGTHAFLDKYLLPYFKGMHFCNDGIDASTLCGVSVSGTGANYSFVNGVGFAAVLRPGTSVPIIIDVNGGKKPNRMGTDVFYFNLTPTDGLLPNYYTKGETRAQIINDGTFGCTTAAITYQKYACTALIYYDGWRIADDYPW